MRIILASLLLFVNSAVIPQVIVGYYYGNYANYPPNHIDYNCLTHIAHAFIVPDSNGTFHYPDWFLYPELVSMAHENGKKIVISVGGWGGSDGFRPIAADSIKRNKFIKHLVTFIKFHNYDGADIDWEYPKAEDKDNYTRLISELRDAFDKEGIEILSAALPAMDWNNVFDTAILKDKFTWFGIMTYDFYGPWEKRTGHNTALYSTRRQILSVDASIKHWLDKGVPRNKLYMGFEFAGYQLKSPGLYEEHKGGSSLSYVNSLKKQKDNWEYHWDDNAKVPYYKFNDSIITIDDSASVRYKSEYIIKQDLGGAIIWKLGLDYNNGINELSNIIGEKILSVLPLRPEIEKPNLLVDATSFELKWSRAKHTSSYRIQFSETNDFHKINFEFITADQSAVIDSLESFKIYYCRIRGENLSGEGEWSEQVTFTTYNQAALLSSGGILTYSPKSFKNEVTLIYSPAAAGHIKLIITNIYGEIKEIFSGEFNSLPFVYRVNLENIPAGEYQFRISDIAGTISRNLKVYP